MERRGPAFDDFRPVSSKSQWGTTLNVFTSEETVGAPPSALHHKNPPRKLCYDEDILSFMGDIDADSRAFQKKNNRKEQEKEVMNIAITPAYQNLSLTDFMTSVQVISMLCDCH